MNRLLEMFGQASDHHVHQIGPEEPMDSQSVYLLRKMYYEALKPFSTKTGTKYPSKQKEIDFHRRSHVILRDRTGDMTEIAVTTEMILQNEADKLIHPAEKKAIGRLQQMFEEIRHSGTYGPDLVIKAFNDLDLVFFGGCLRGRVRVWWSTCATDTNFEIGTAPRNCRRCCYGFTRKGRFLQHGEIHIVLNAGLVFFEEYPPLELMISTLLHEMCHAVEYVKCRHPYPPGRQVHDEHFETRVSVVHERAMRILGLGAVGEWENYKQRHWLGCSHGESGYLRGGEATVELDGREIPAELE